MILKFVYLLATVHLSNAHDTCPFTRTDFYTPLACSDYLTRHYDFIIVGGGTAGCVLANRLSENADVQVLLLEDGGYPSRKSQIPLEFLLRQETREDWSFRARQRGLFKGFTNRENKWPQGHALGGSSNINGMLYTRGVQYDYDRWAYLTQDPIWAWDRMRFYFNKANQYVRSMNYTTTVESRRLIALAAAKRHIPVNGGGMFGYADHRVTIKDSARFSMAKAYLRPITHRENLCVLVNRHVRKVVVRKRKAIGVEVQDPSGIVFLKARMEVIVTAGAINSPKLLMLSGIGPRSHLAEFGIPIHADLPVGQFLQDHLVVHHFVTLPDDVPMPPHNDTMALYCATGKGLGDVELENFLGFFNTRCETNRPDVEFIHFEFLRRDPIYLEALIAKFGFIDEFAEQLRNANQRNGLLLFLPTLLHPLSRGEILLRNASSKAPPYVFPHYLQHEEDVRVLLYSIQCILRRLLRTAPFAKSKLLRFTIPECDQLVYKSNDYWRCYYTYFAGTIYHPVGTCRMGVDPFDSVVDSRLRVWGIRNLRVADSSTIPELISGHTNIPTCGLAEQVADLIKADYNI